MAFVIFGLLWMALLVLVVVCVTTLAALLSNPTLAGELLFPLLLLLSVIRLNFLSVQPQRVTETLATLFDLDESVLRSFKAADRQSYTTERRLDQLLSQLYGQNGIRLPLSYASGHSTGATQT